MVIHPDYSMIRRLKELWAASFDDTLEYIDFYFNNIFNENNCAVYIEGGQPVSVVHWLNCRINTSKCACSAIYLYAIATDSNYRRRGNIKKIYDYIVNYCKENNIEGIVINTNEMSKPLTENYGFTPEILIDNYTINDMEINKNYNLSECKFERFYQLRKYYVDKAPLSVYWSKPELEYFYNEHIICGHKFFELSGGYCIVQKENRSIFIEEFFCEREHQLQFLQCICGYFNSCDIFMRIRQGYELSKDIKYTKKDTSVIAYTYSCTDSNVPLFEKIKKESASAGFPYLNILGE